MKPVTIVKVYPTACWIEDTIWGSRRVMLQHEGCDPFCWASFDYDYRYTSNSGTYQAAHDCAASLGYAEPIEHRHGKFPVIRWWHRAAAPVLMWFFDWRMKRRARATGASQHE